VRAGTDLGNALPEVAAELGLPATCRVIAGCLDHYAAAIGVGNDRAGRVSETTGTVLATLAVVNAWETGSDERIFRGPGPSEGAFFRMTFGEVSANLLDHYRGCLPDLPSFESLSALCGTADRLWLDDEAPVDSIKATIRAWAPTEPRPDVVRAIFQAVARALVRQVQQVAAQPVDAVRSSGGGARCRAWLQLKADALKKMVIAPATEEPALVGAATLAARALGWPPFAETDAAAAEQRVFTP
jgi:xylulokinase